MRNQEPAPPRWPQKILGWLCDERHIDIFLGDLQELYLDRLPQLGPFWAKWYYVRDTFDLLRPFALKKKVFFSNHRHMYGNYFKIAVRNLLKHKIYAGINLLGLSVGIACFILIFLYVKYQTGFDRYHEYADTIYRVTVEDYNPGKTINTVFSAASPMHGKVLRDDYPQVEASVRFNPWNFPVIKYGDRLFDEPFFNYVEPSIFDVFTFSFLEGQALGALDHPNQLVITRSTAKKYFGDEPALGKVLNVTDAGAEMDFTISGVIEDFPAQSHMDYHFLASWITYQQRAPSRELNDYYGNYNYPTYFRISPESNIDALQAQMPDMLEKYIDQIDGQSPSEKVGLVFQKLTDIHLTGRAGSTEMNPRYLVFLFSIIGLFILIIACINYINLALAKYIQRGREVGVRKVMGAQRNQVSRQFLIESFCYVILATAIAMFMARGALPWVNNFCDQELTLNPFINRPLLLILASLIIGVAVLAGAYPAFLMARLNPIQALNDLPVKSAKNRWSSALVVFQFTLSAALIAGVFIIERQISYVRSLEVGFDRQSVVKFWASPTILDKLETFKSELLSNPNIQKVAVSSRVPTGRLGDALDARIVRDDSEEIVQFRLPFIRADRDYFDVYKLGLSAGSYFGPKVASDTMAQLMINETAAKRLGWQTPSDAVGNPMSYGWYRGHIVGVLKDFHFESLHAAIQPMIFLHNETFVRNMSVRIADGSVSSTMQFLQEKFKAYNPDRTFNPSFVDDLYNAQYAREDLLSQITGIFSGIAMLIACLGLLGLVAFTVERRAKEISIRKVLGASVPNILVMISRKYFQLLLIALVFAIPGVWYFMHDWLSNFAYRISLGVGPFILVALSILMIALFTVWAQSLKFVLANPIHWLRDD